MFDAQEITHSMPAAAQGQNWCLGLPTLSGDGLCLREPTTADAADLADIAKRDSIGRFTQPFPASKAGWVRFIQRLLADRFAGLSMCFVVTRQRTSETIGLVLIRRLELSFRIAECQFLLDKSSWISGLATTGLSYALDFAFLDVGLHRLECRSLRSDEAAVLLSAGFTAEGLLRTPSRQTQGFEGQTVWSVLRADWLSRGLRSPRRGPVSRHSGDLRMVAAVAGESEPRPTWSIELPVLSGPRVTLREIDSADGEALLRELEPAEIEACIEPPPTTVEVFQQYIGWARRQRTRGRAVCFSIFVEGDSRSVGLLQVRGLDQRFAVAEWGAGLAHRFRGTGIFGEVMSLIAPFIFDTLGVRRLEARTSAGNAGALASLRRLGAVKEACLRQSFLKDGQYHDDELWAVTDVDWRRSREGRAGRPAMTA